MNFYDCNVYVNAYNNKYDTLRKFFIQIMLVSYFITIMTYVFLRTLSFELATNS